MDIFIYSVCFGVGLLFAVLSAIFGHVFGGHEMDAHIEVGTGGHADAGFQNTGVPGLSPFSPTTICSFVTAFGGFGLIFAHINLTRSPWVSAPLSVVSALGIAACVMVVFTAIFQKVQGSSEAHVAELVGVTGTVITPIPANGVGEVAFVRAGSRYTAPARDERGAPVANGQTVKVVRIVGSQFFVVPI